MHTAPHSSEEILRHQSVPLQPSNVSCHLLACHGFSGSHFQRQAGAILPRTSSGATLSCTGDAHSSCWWQLNEVFTVVSIGNGAIPPNLRLHKKFHSLSEETKKLREEIFFSFILTEGRRKKKKDKKSSTAWQFSQVTINKELWLSQVSIGKFDIWELQTLAALLKWKKTTVRFLKQSLSWISLLRGPV
jgi:hypothetical protein